MEFRGILNVEIAGYRLCGFGLVDEQHPKTADSPYFLSQAVVTISSARIGSKR